MANNYELSSSMLVIPDDRRDEVQLLIDEGIEEWLKENDEEEWYEGEIELTADGVWFHHDESCNASAFASVAQHIMKGLDIKGPFVIHYCFECSKPRIDEFGGGTIVVMQDHIEYFDGGMMAQAYIKNL